MPAKISLVLKVKCGKLRTEDCLSAIALKATAEGQMTAAVAQGLWRAKEDGLRKGGGQVIG